jgi:hypothetical protein
VSSYEDRTEQELQDEPRDRDRSVEGTEDELERLEHDDAQRRRDEQQTEREARSPLRPREAARRAAQQLGDLRGREVDGVTGFERTGGGWRVLVELVEVSRVPRSTDVLGAYEVTLDGDGELVGYDRVRRYVRAQTGEDEP